MNRNEQEMYSNISSIAKSLEKIATALEENNTLPCDKIDSAELDNFRGKDIPGFEGVLNDLDNLYQPTSSNPDPAGYDNEDDSVHNDYLENLIGNMNHIEYLNFHHDMAFGFASSDTAALNNHIYDLEYEECLDAIKRALLITGDRDYIEAVECSNLGLGYNEETKDELAREYIKELLEKENTTQPENDPYTYDNDLNEYVDGIKNDSDHDIRSTAAYYEKQIGKWKDIKTKKDAILDYVTNEFGLHGARYTDIIKFAYYLGSSNAPKYTSEYNRGYYSCAFSSRMNGHLIQGGKDYLVKGINKDGKERYFAHSSVDSFTDYYKTIE